RNVSVVLVVTLSLPEQPESLAAVKSGDEGVAGGVLSSVKVAALPVKPLPALSVAVACAVNVPSLSNDQSGNATLLVHVREVLPVVAVCSVGRSTAPDCQAEPCQYRLSTPRFRVKVVLSALRPEPTAKASATLPRKLAGTVAARNKLPLAGVVTDAVTGGVLS